MDIIYAKPGSVTTYPQSNMSPNTRAASRNRPPETAEVLLKDLTEEQLKALDGRIGCSKKQVIFFREVLIAIATELESQATIENWINADAIFEHEVMKMYGGFANVVRCRNRVQRCAGTKVEALRNPRLEVCLKKVPNAQGQKKLHIRVIDNPTPGIVFAYPELPSDGRPILKSLKTAEDFEGFLYDRQDIFGPSDDELMNLFGRKATGEQAFSAAVIGPPNTGKTTTIINFLVCLTSQGYLDEVVFSSPKMVKYLLAANLDSDGFDVNRHKGKKHLLDDESVMVDRMFQIAKAVQEHGLEDRWHLVSVGNHHTGALKNVSAVSDNSIGIF